MVQLDLTTEIEVFCSSSDAILRNRMISLKQDIKYFNFQGKIQLDHPVLSVHNSNDCSLYTCNTASGVDIIPPQRVTLAIGSEEHHKRTSSPIAATAPPVGGDGAAGGTVTAAPAAGAAPAAAAAGAGAAADPE